MHCLLMILDAQPSGYITPLIRNSHTRVGKCRQIAKNSRHFMPLKQRRFPSMRVYCSRASRRRCLLLLSHPIHRAHNAPRRARRWHSSCLQPSPARKHLLQLIILHLQLRHMWRRSHVRRSWRSFAHLLDIHSWRKIREVCLYSPHALDELV